MNAMWIKGSGTTHLVVMEIACLALGNEGGWDDGGEDGESMNVGQDNEDEDSSRPRRFSSSLVQ